MASTKRGTRAQAQRAGLPGSIYLNKNRYWWKVQLPGEDRPLARPLKPVGARFAASDPQVALEVAKTMYQQALFAEAARVDQAASITTIASLAHAYLAHCDQYYVGPDGQKTSEPANIRYTLKPLIELFGILPIEEFGPLRLIDVRNRMIALAWSRSLINQRVGRIKRMFKWAVGRQVISPVIYQGLIAVEGLKRGRSAARETPKRKPVEEGHVYGVLEYTTPVAAAMIELQLLTGMRPGELVIMRPSDIDRSGAVWHYRPERHKNSYRGSERIVSIGPRGQEILRPFLLRPAGTFLSGVKHNSPSRCLRWKCYH